MVAHMEVPKIRNSGDIGPALLVKLAEMIPPEDIAERIKDMMNATYENARGDVKTDWRAVEAGVKLYLSYQIGMPVQRQVVVQQSVESGDQTMDRLMSSPAAIKVLEAMLEKAKGGVIEG